MHLTACNDAVEESTENTGFSIRVRIIPTTRECYPESHASHFQSVVLTKTFIKLNIIPARMGISEARLQKESSGPKIFSDLRSVSQSVNGD